MIAEHDDDGSGALDFAEFVEMLATSSVIMGVESNQDATANIAAEISNLRESFSMFDMDCDGVLSFDEMKMVNSLLLFCLVCPLFLSSCLHAMLLCSMLSLFALCSHFGYPLCQMLRNTMFSAERRVPSSAKKFVACRRSRN